MDVTHSGCCRGAGYDIIISFGPSDFQGYRGFEESERYKLFQEMKNEKLRYSGQHSDIARKCALEWLSQGQWSYMLQEVQEYRKLKAEQKKDEEVNKLTVEKCLQFLKDNGFEFRINLLDFDALSSEKA